MLKIDSLTRSVVGRVSSPGGAINFRPLAEPEITRTLSPHYQKVYTYIVHKLRVLSRFLNKKIAKDRMSFAQKIKAPHMPYKG